MRIALKYWIMIIIFVLLVIPFEVTVVPNWRVTVVDESGRPIPNIYVEQTWKYYLLETEAHYQKKESDANGELEFPARSLRGSGLLYVIGYVRNIFASGVHASFGKSSWLMASPEKCMGGDVIYMPGKELPKQLVVKRSVLCK